MSNFTINSTCINILQTETLQLFSPKFNAILIILFLHQTCKRILICELKDGTVYKGYGQNNNSFLVLYDQYWVMGC